MAYHISNVKDFSGGLKEAVNYFHSKWGNKKNYNFYFDAISNSQNKIHKLPKFYLMLKNNKIIGCYALLVNDLISRQDLMPWFACLYIEENERGKRLSGMMFHHAKIEAQQMGFATIYLITDLDGYYEKFGWTRIEDGFDITGDRTRIYKKSIT